MLVIIVLSVSVIFFIYQILRDDVILPDLDEFLGICGQGSLDTSLDGVELFYRGCLRHQCCNGICGTKGKRKSSISDKISANFALLDSPRKSWDYYPFQSTLTLGPHTQMMLYSKWNTGAQNRNSREIYFLSNRITYTPPHLAALAPAPINTKRENMRYRPKTEKDIGNQCSSSKRSWKPGPP